ncbi:MAG: hypothetical protein ACJAY8_001275, partial [Sphingobacteriales bacterium]
NSINQPRVYHSIPCPATPKDNQPTNTRSEIE